MGCDIHGYIESRPNLEHNQNYWHKDADLHLGRNYAMFGFLAGVRGLNEPIVEPRGFDDNSSLKWEYCLRVNDEQYSQDAEGYTSKERADKYVAGGYSRMIGEMVTHPDWHTASWLTADEMKKVLLAYKETYTDLRMKYDAMWDAVLAMLKCIPNSRFVFWFDN